MICLHNQVDRVTLVETGHESEAALLTQYMREIVPDDATNREGHAAKVYFNALFGMGFSRGQENPINAALNYGYGLILSSFNREVTLCGYLPHIGLFHDNMFNPYNLSCDLMEPFRVVIDRKVIDLAPVEFGKKEKLALLETLHSLVHIAGKEQTVMNAVKLYSRSVFEAIEASDANRIDFMEL